MFRSLVSIVMDKFWGATFQKQEIGACASVRYAGDLRRVLQSSCVVDLVMKI